jgi:hypothetical protein
MKLKKETRDNIILTSWSPGMYFLTAVADNYRLVNVYKIVKL